MGSCLNKNRCTGCAVFWIYSAWAGALEKHGSSRQDVQTVPAGMSNCCLDSWQERVRKFSITGPDAPQLPCNRKTRSMKTFDTLPYDEVFRLYREKHRALREGDTQRLLEIRAECPDMFDPEKDRMVGELIEITKALQESDWYRERCREEELKRLNAVPKSVH